MKEITFQPDYKGREPLWHNAIYPGQMILFTAPFKAGKTTLLMSLFGNLALGRKWGPWAPVRPLKTMYVAFEDDEDDIQKAIKPFGGTPNLRMISNEWTDNEAFSLKKLDELIQGNKPDIIVLDPWMYMFSFDPNDPKKMREALKPIRSFARKNDITIFLSHHDRKESQLGEDNPWFSAAGSHVLGGSVDAQWNIVKPRTGLRHIQITYSRKKDTELFKLMTTWHKDKGIGIQYHGGHFHFPDEMPMGAPLGPL